MSNVIYGQIAPKSISFCQYSGCGKPTNNPRFCNLSCAISCANIKKKRKKNHGIFIKSKTMFCLWRYYSIQTP